MSVKYNIGGSATINGVIMINIAKGKVARAVRSFDGNISVKELLVVNKAMKLYKTKIERPVSKIPAIREIFKMLLMFLIVISSFIVGMGETFSFSKRWSIKRIISGILLIASFYVFIFLDDYLTFAVLIILIIYFYKEIVVMLKYHGAEHKSINMYENTDDLSELTVESANAFSRTHKRCGTNIIFLLIPLSILYYFVVEQFFAMLTTGNVLDFFVSLLLLGISVELFKLFQKPLMQWMLKPGIFLQEYVTTREPDNSHLEVAIKALKAVI